MNRQEKRLADRVARGDVPDKAWYEDDERQDGLCATNCHDCGGFVLHVNSRGAKVWHMCFRCDREQAT